MRVLGIETSCDETGVAIYDSKQGVMAHALYSQVALHTEYGGVVPELASRDHIRKTVPLIKEVMAKAAVSGKDIHGVAYTAGPGLIGALLVGSAIGRSLALSWQVPAIAVHHMEGHLLAAMLEDNPPKFPFIALLVSGGHTQLIKVMAVGDYQLLGETLDDAAGEAFDKTAKMLDLGYPGGPAIAQCAKAGSPGRFHFPRPMTNRPWLDFSFSGLKTFAVNTLRQFDKPDEQIKADIAYAFQEAVVDTIAIKCQRAMKETAIKRLVIAGGVGANERLREKLDQLAIKLHSEVFYPRFEFCTDNGAMIAYTGYLRLKAGQHESLEFTARARWPMEELCPVT